MTSVKVFWALAKLRSKMDNMRASERLGLPYLNSLSRDKFEEHLKTIHDPVSFCKSHFELFITEPSTCLINFIYRLLHFQPNEILKEEILSYFGLPIFIKLSETRLQYEINLCQDKRLAKAVSNIIDSLGNGDKDEPLRFQAECPTLFIKSVISSTDMEFTTMGIKLIILLLLQPSCRRFVKPFLEDNLFISHVKTKISDLKLLHELETAFFYPVDEFSGVYFNSHEEYIYSHFSKIRTLQYKILDHQELTSLSRMALSTFSSYDKIYQAIIILSPELLKLILVNMGCAGFPMDLSNSVLLDAIAGSLVLRQPLKFDSISTFPTEANLNECFISRPLTSESLSSQDLFQRHMKLMQKSLFEDLSLHVNESIQSCRPVLNSLSKTEFSSWTRDAMEVVSSAIVTLSRPDIQKEGKYQNVELEISIPIAPLDELTLKSWMDLKRSDVVFVCRVEAQEDGGYVLKTMRSVILDSRTFSKNSITFKLLVDPDQFISDSRTEVYGKLNFIVKRSSSESNDIRILQSIKVQSILNLPDIVEDAILGISHPDEIYSPLDFDNSLDGLLNYGLSIVDGPLSSGCTTLLKNATIQLHQSNKNTVVIFRSGPALDLIYGDLINSGIPEHEIVRLGFSSTIGNIQKKYNELIKACVDKINNEILPGFQYNSIYTCGEAEYIMRSHIKPGWDAFRILLDSGETFDALLSIYPFAKCTSFDANGKSLSSFEKHYNEICSIFNVAKQLSPLELLQNHVNISKYVLGNMSKIVLMTSKYAAINAKILSESGLHFESLLVDDCNLIPEIEVLLTLTSQSNSSNLKRLALFGHNNGGRPQCFNDSLREAGACLTLMDRFLYSGFSKTLHLLDSHCPFAKQENQSLPSVLFKNRIQFVNVSPLLGKGEEMPMRNYIQNLDEGEFAVSLFQLLRLKGIPANEIAILTAYKGQVDLIKEILQTRCNWTDFYCEPAFIGTIDQSSGVHFKNVIVSLVRTKSVGFLSDKSRIELACTRASENLVMLGSSNLFASHDGGYFEELVTKNGSELILENDTKFCNAEQIAKFVYNLSLEKLQLK